MNVKRALIGGTVGTAVMTFLMLTAPLVGMPRPAIGQMLSTFLTISVGLFPLGATAGWIIHLLFGVVLALIYAGLFVTRVPGSPLIRGAIYGACVFVFAQLVFMPLMGAGLFSRGDPLMILGSFCGNVIYGSVLGVIYGAPAPTPAA